MLVRGNRNELSGKACHGAALEAGSIDACVPENVSLVGCHAPFTVTLGGNGRHSGEMLKGCTGLAGAGGKRLRELRGSMSPSPGSRIPPITSGPAVQWGCSYSISRGVIIARSTPTDVARPATWPKKSMRSSLWAGQNAPVW